MRMYASTPQVSPFSGPAAGSVVAAAVVVVVVVMVGIVLVGEAVVAGPKTGTAIGSTMGAAACARIWLVAGGEEWATGL